MPSGIVFLQTEKLPFCCLVLYIFSADLLANNLIAWKFNCLEFLKDTFALYRIELTGFICLFFFFQYFNYVDFIIFMPPLFLKNEKSVSLLSSALMCNVLFPKTALSSFPLPLLNFTGLTMMSSDMVFFVFTLLGSSLSFLDP